MLRLLPRLCNVTKNTGVNSQTKNSQTIFIERRWLYDMSPKISSDRLKEKDKVDVKFQLIYNPPHDNLLTGATALCAFSSYFSSLTLSSLTYDWYFERNSDVISQISIGDIAGLGGLAIASIIALHFCRIMPLRIYKHEKDYIAILPSAIPFTTRRITFKKGDIKNKRKKGEWIRKVFASIMNKLFGSGFDFPTMYKPNGNRIVLISKIFEKPLDFFEMFANTEKYVRRAKRLEALSKIER